MMKCSFLRKNSEFSLEDLNIVAKHDANLLWKDEEGYVMTILLTN